MPGLLFSLLLHYVLGHQVHLACGRLWGWSSPEIGGRFFGVTSCEQCLRFYLCISNPSPPTPLNKGPLNE